MTSCPCTTLSPRISSDAGRFSAPRRPVGPPRCVKCGDTAIRWSTRFLPVGYVRRFRKKYPGFLASRPSNESLSYHLSHHSRDRYPPRIRRRAGPLSGFGIFEPPSLFPPFVFPYNMRGHWPPSGPPQCRDGGKTCDGFPWQLPPPGLKYRKALPRRWPGRTRFSSCRREKRRAKRERQHRIDGLRDDGRLAEARETFCSGVACENQTPAVAPALSERTLPSGRVLSSRMESRASVDEISKVSEGHTGNR